MGVLKTVVEFVGFMCNAECWRMAVLWTLSLIFSYLKLFYHGLFGPKSNCYPRCSPKDSVSPSVLMPRPVCIVTGATSGLGAAAAEALSKEGFHVVLVGRSSKLLSKVISDIKSRNHDAYLKAFEVDLSSFISTLEFKHSLQQWLRDSNMHLSVQLLITMLGSSQHQVELLLRDMIRCLLRIMLVHFAIPKFYFPFLKVARFLLVWLMSHLSLIEMAGQQRNCLWEVLY